MGLSAELIVNTHSRRGRGDWPLIRAALDRLPIEVNARAVSDPARLGAEMEAAIAAAPDLLILGGGDGTISRLAPLLVGTGIPLAVLPLGTANSFARGLGVPLDLEAAARLAVEGRRRRIDLGRIESHHFVSMAAIGLSPLIAGSVPEGLKRWFGRAGYLAWAALRFARFRPFDLRIEGDGVSERLRAVEVRIANTGFHGGTELVESAHADDGTIVVQAVRGRARRRLVLNWAGKLLPLPAAHEDEVTVRGTALRIATDPPLPISLDGEVLARTPVTVEVVPGAIEVLVPR
ncbi:diacylglycerol/lipid kinase family protein [Sphingosinithalassobacter sp. LHW66-3]|uniref:diacylglycerol/lipid kinase family protein n=1 Tax=Sphingosinithalassobacter sp. LHW66-3 TaxID=3424718 RepID=UPI003D6B9C1A